MNSMLVLLGTEGCHLCEQAEELVLLVIAKCSTELALNKIDIVDEAQYLAAYELIIPVLCHVESGQELHWPFTEKQVQLFVTEILG